MDLRQCDGVAIQTYAKDGRREGKAILQVYNKDVVHDLVQALKGHPSIRIEPVTLKSDVFGRNFYVECEVPPPGLDAE